MLCTHKTTSLPVWIISSQVHHRISTNSQPFLVGIVSSSVQPSITFVVDQQASPFSSLLSEMSSLRTVGLSWLLLAQKIQSLMWRAWHLNRCSCLGEPCTSKISLSTKTSLQASGQQWWHCWGLGRCGGAGSHAGGKNVGVGMEKWCQSSCGGCVPATTSRGCRGGSQDGGVCRLMRSTRVSVVLQKYGGLSVHPMGKVSSNAMSGSSPGPTGKATLSVGMSSALSHTL